MQLPTEENKNETSEGLNNIDHTSAGFENPFENNFETNSNTTLQNSNVLQGAAAPYNQANIAVNANNEKITQIPSLNNIPSMNQTLSQQMNQSMNSQMNQSMNSQMNQPMNSQMNQHINNQPTNFSGVNGGATSYNETGTSDLQSFQTPQTNSQQSNSPHPSHLGGMTAQQGGMQVQQGQGGMQVQQGQGGMQVQQGQPGMTNNDLQQTVLALQQLPPQVFAEKMQMVVMQMSQLKGQISAAQSNMTFQTKEMINQMMYRLNYLQELYMQMVNIQQQKQQLQLQQQNQMRQMNMMNPILNNNAQGMQTQNFNIATMQQQQYMQQFNPQKQQNINNIRAMQALQQRMMAVQMMSNQRMKMQLMNNMQGNIPPYMLQQQQQQQQHYQMISPKQIMNNFPHSQAMNAYRNQMYMMNNNMGGNMGRNMGGGMSTNRFTTPSIGRRRRRRSETESSEFSSSPEPTRKEIDDMANNIGTLRRSTRAKKQKSYAFDLDAEDQDNPNTGKEGEETKYDKLPNGNEGSGAPELLPVQMTSINDNNVAVIDKILADRIRPVKKETDPLIMKVDITIDVKIEETNVIDTEGDEEEFYVKYKYYSYLHCEWLTLEEMKLKDRLSVNKVKRYKQKKSENIWQFTMDDEYFNPDYIEVDRILAKTTTSYISDDPITGPSFDQTVNSTVDHNLKTEDEMKSTEITFVKNEDQLKGKAIIITHYLIKWGSLPYEDSTWEPEDLIDDDCIKEFEEREAGPSPEKLRFVQRPNMSSWSELPKAPIYKENNDLRNYQLEGLNWLRFCYYRWQNCILADEMGLGKTIQSIALLQNLYDLGMKGPFLIIAPLSTIHNWYREFRSWTDINVVMFHGTANSRNIIHKYELNYNNKTTTDVYKFDALITTYEMILSELKFLSSIKWRVSVVDEAHRLKNKKCKLLESLSYLHIEHRVLLTGTPLQNSLEELYSLLSFLDPQNIPSEQAFMEEFGNLQTNEQVSKLQRVLKPIMLRRLKEDVEKNIAPKEETIIEVEMTSIQRRIYKSILEKNFSFLSKGTSTSNMPNLMNTMMELRKCCNHPFLIKGCEDKITSDFFSHDSDDMAAHHLRSLIESSGKMVLVDKLLPKLKASGHRILLFSQMVKVLDLIEDYLIQKKYIFERIDGSIRGNLRQAAIDRFSKPDSDRFIFLLCTKAGGLGINLTAADTVIIFDSDWNPQNDIQAQARCHRIGQSKAVKVYRLICRNSYEREMFDRASLKLGLDKAVLQNINNGGATNETSVPTNTFNEKQPLSKRDIEDLLKRGAYGALMDEDTAESAQFCAEDIDQILERRAVVVQISGESKGSSFAKASFQAGKKDDIDVDDPLFWEKWAQKAKLSVNKSSDLVFDTPRERKPISYDDPDAYYTDIESDVELDEFDGSTKRTSFVSTRNNWIRVECFKVEKQLLIFGWGRWDIITLYANFKTLVSYDDVINISRCILAYCWHHAKVDASTKNFIEGIIKNSLSKGASSKDDDNDDYNYKPYVKTRLSRRNSGKRSKRMKDKQPPCAIEVTTDWKTCDADQFILDSSYRKHLHHNANKILLRIRLLYVLQYEIVGKTEDLIMNGTLSENITLPVKLPSFSNNSLLSSWWDEDCDKSLLIGTFKHGYEKYKEMLIDIQFVFHELIPDDKLARFIKLQEDQLEAQLVKQSTVTTVSDGTPKRRGRKRRQQIIPKSPQLMRNTRNSLPSVNSVSKEKDIDAQANTNEDLSDFNSEEENNTQEAEEEPLQEDQAQESEFSQNAGVLKNEDDDDKANDGSSDEWPHASDLNTRFRRLVTSFWKSRKSGGTEKMVKKHKTKASIGADLSSSLSVPASIFCIRFMKKEENEFYRTVMQFGLEFNYSEYEQSDERELNSVIFESSFKFIWDNFRNFKPFEKRSDEQLTMYAKYLVISSVFIMSNTQDFRVIPAAMFNNINSVFSFSLDNLPENFKPLDGLTIEKSAKLLNRLDLMELMRQKVLPMENIEIKMKSIPHDSLLLSDFPDWWKVGIHDFMLLQIINKYGISNPDQQIFLDENFDLKNVLMELFNVAREKQWSNFLEQYSSPNDLSFEMISALLKWPKPRIIVSRFAKLLHFAIHGIWPSITSEIEEKYSSMVKVHPVPIAQLPINTSQEITQGFCEPIQTSKTPLNQDVALPIDTSFQCNSLQVSPSIVINTNLNEPPPSKISK